jgi:hypothetical protein
MENNSMVERIRARAYELWESDGGPDGRDDEYWEKARTLIESESAATAVNGDDDKPLDT